MADVHVPKVPLGSQGFVVSKQGLGCMGMSFAYGDPAPEDEMIALMKRAVEKGVTFFDTSDVYGPHTNEKLVGKAIREIGREKVQLATKFGIQWDPATKARNVVGRPEYVRACCEASLERLGVDYIDLYYQHRIDNNVPIEITVGAMKELVKEGKVKYLGLSEASADTIRRAHAVHPITAVQLEWSLWSRDAEESIIPTCRELGIGIVAYSPLGRGFFSGKAVVEALKDNDFRVIAQPRFKKENLEKNKALYEEVAKLAAEKGCYPGQLALAWVQHQGDDAVTIPGTTKVANLEQNIAACAVKLTSKDLEEIGSVITPEMVHGDRYAEQAMTWQYEKSPPLSSWKEAQAHA